MKKNTERYYPFTHAYYKLKLYGVLFLRYGVQQTKFFVILDHLLPPNNPNNQNLEKMKKCQEILSFYTFTINGSWDIDCNTYFFCHFGPFFALLPSKNNLENEILKKWKTPLDIIIILHVCNINDNHMMYGSWDMECDRQYFLSFWATFCLLPH